MGEDRKKKSSATAEINALRSNLAKLREDINYLHQGIAKLRGNRENSLKNEAEKAGADIPDNQVNFRQRKILRGHYGKIYAMQWVPGSQSANVHNLVSASQDGKLIIWNGLTTNKIRMIPLKSSWVMTCAYSPSSNFVACGGLDNLCTVFELQGGNATDQVGNQIELRHHEGYLSSCRFLNDQNILTSSGDSTCLLWDIPTSKVVKRFAAHSSDVMSVSIDKHNNSVFVSGSCDTTAKVFDIRADDNSSCVGTFRGHEADINFVDWFPDGNAFASGSDDSSLRLFDKRAYRQLNNYTNQEFLSGVTSLCFSNSGRYLFAGYDENPFAVVWDTLTANSLQIMNNLVKRVSCVGMQSQGHALCTGSWDYNLRIWA